MKNLAILMILISAITSCDKFMISPNITDDSSQIVKSNVPSPVINAFTAKYYPTASRMEWQKEDGNTWKVKFYFGGLRWEAIFAAAGTFISEKVN
jgi:hypothetical protein